MEHSAFQRLGGQDSGVESLVHEVLAESIPTAQVEREPERQVFKRSPEEEEAILRRRMMDAAAKTKFATGNPERDMENFQIFSKIVQMISGRLGGPE